MISAFEPQPTPLVASTRPSFGTLILAVLAPFLALALTALPTLVESAKHALGG